MYIKKGQDIEISWRTMNTYLVLGWYRKVNEFETGFYTNID